MKIAKPEEFYAWVEELASKPKKQRRVRTEDL
jgi:hypothetical protein